MNILRYTFFISFLFIAFTSFAALRCENTPGRAWWDVLHYDLHVNFNTEEASLSGYNIITSKVLTERQSVIEVDMQLPMVIDSVMGSNPAISTVPVLIPFMQEDNICYVMLPFAGYHVNDTFSIKIFYHGQPKQAVNPPWDGGLVNKTDARGNRWMAMACESAGSSVWWPCKDIRGDEPDEGVDLYYECPAKYTAIGNGRLVNQHNAGKDRKTWHWRTKAPINNYNVTFYLGVYENWEETYSGELGKLSLNYFVLKGNKAKAQQHFSEVKDMLHCFESWMGPYPFYEDGYKLVEAPYLGMEHQSAVAWGNNYQKGYNGTDRSATGYGLLFDFLIVHESGHEWFGNNITAAAPQDTWLQEGFTSYAEALYLECIAGKDKAFAYQHGKWRNIHNDAPPQGNPGSCDNGSTDHYDKAGAMIHMIRAIIDNDSLFRQMLRTMNQEFRYRTVTAAEIEQFINYFSGKGFNKIFEQYLRTKDIPQLLLKKGARGTIFYKWEQAVKGFDMPIILETGTTYQWIKPSAEWQSITLEDVEALVKVSDIFLVNSSWVIPGEG